MSLMQTRHLTGKVTFQKEVATIKVHNMLSTAEKMLTTFSGPDEFDRPGVSV
jgi:hypothetical protein